MSLIVAYLLAPALPAAAQLRVVTYNTGNSQGGQTLARSDMDVVLGAIGTESVGGIAKPLDVLVLQEQASPSSSTQSFVNVLNGLYGGNDYRRGSTTGSSLGGGVMGIVYNSATVTLVDELAFGALSGNGQLRQTLRYQLRPVGYDAAADFYVYVDHYKAGSSGSEQSQRLVEAQSVRNNADALGQGTHVIYAGDFNVQSSSEAMYQELLSAGPGQAFDPIDTPGTWHNSSSLRHTHTQSPATSSAYNGQVLGGMDDRFDFQLVSGEMLDGEGLAYIDGTYRAFGNNGTHGCCNSPLTGSGASSATLAALRSVSDHIPVVADYQVPAVLDVLVGSLPSTIPLGASVALDVSVANLADVVAVAGADELDYSLTTSGALSGAATGIDFALGGGNTHQVVLDTSTPGLQSGQITVASSSQGVAGGFFTLPIEYTVGQGGGGPIFGVVARDNFDGQLNRLAFTQTPDTDAAPFGSPADGFGVYQAGVSSSIPFALVDDSFSVFPADVQGIVDASPDSPGYKGDRWFGVVDVENADNPSGVAEAVWTFDVAGARDLEISIDMAAMGDFDADDSFVWKYAFDNGPAETLFSSLVDEAGTATYTLADGDMVTLDDPLVMTGDLAGPIELSNSFQTLTAELTGQGSELTVTLEATTNGEGSPSANHEAYALDNIVLRGWTGAETADLDDDGDIDGRDLLLVQRNDPTQTPAWESQFGVDSASATIPEPNAWLIVAVGVAGLWLRR